MNLFTLQFFRLGKEESGLHKDSLQPCACKLCKTEPYRKAQMSIKVRGHKQVMLPGKRENKSRKMQMQYKHKQKRASLSFKRLLKDATAGVNRPQIQELQSAVFYWYSTFG